MSGHNKWSQIKHKKGAEDAKKAKLFSSLVKQITIESKLSSGNKNLPGLKAAIEKAKAQNMPSENIERAIKKGAGLGAGSMEEILCEAYGPGGVGIIVEATTDNKNRTIQEIKHILSKNGGNMGAQGSVIWAFRKSSEEGWIPTTKIPLSEENEQKLEVLIDELKNYNEIENIFTNCEFSLS